MVYILPAQPIQRYLFPLIYALLLIDQISWLKPRQSPSQTFADKRSFTFEVAVASDGPLVGKTIQQAGLRNLQSIFLAEIERSGAVITAVAPEEILRGGDRLVFVGETDAIVDILRINGLVPAVGHEPSLDRDVPERMLMEAVVAQSCEVIGKTIRDGRFRDRYGCVVLAVARNGESAGPLAPRGAGLCRGAATSHVERSVRPRAPPPFGVVRR